MATEERRFWCLGVAAWLTFLALLRVVVSIIGIVVFSLSMADCYNMERMTEINVDDLRLIKAISTVAIYYLILDIIYAILVLIGNESGNVRLLSRTKRLEGVLAGVLLCWALMCCFLGDTKWLYPRCLCFLVLIYRLSPLIKMRIESMELGSVRLTRTAF